MEILARQLTYLLPLPHGLGTMAGWIEWRAIGALEVIFAFWAVMAGSGAGRGDEERGLVEHWLAQGVSRARYIAARIAAFALITTIVVTLTLAAAGVGSALGKEPVPASALALRRVPAPSREPTLRPRPPARSEEHTSELQTPYELVC